jgi:hypothetical protein
VAGRAVLAALVPEDLAELARALALPLGQRRALQCAAAAAAAAAAQSSARGAGGAGGAGGYGGGGGGAVEVIDLL